MISNPFSLAQNLLRTPAPYTPFFPFITFYLPPVFFPCYGPLPRNFLFPFYLISSALPDCRACPARSTHQHHYTLNPPWASWLVSASGFFFLWHRARSLHRRFIPQLTSTFPCIVIAYGSQQDTVAVDFCPVFFLFFWVGA